jgi:ribosomal protein L30E
MRRDVHWQLMKLLQSIFALMGESQFCITRIKIKKGNTVFFVSVKCIQKRRIALEVYSKLAQSMMILFAVTVEESQDLTKIQYLHAFSILFDVIIILILNKNVCCTVVYH